MKKLLLSLCCAIGTMALFNATAEEITYQYDWTVGTTISSGKNTVAEANKFSKNNETIALGDAEWTINIAKESFNKDGAEISTSKGWQFGTGSVNACPLSFTSSSFKDKTVTAVKVNAGGASSTKATLSVTVGGVTFGETQSLTATATDYVFTGSASGDVVISYSQTTAKAVYLKAIAVAYSEEQGGGETPVEPQPDELGDIVVTCGDKTLVKDEEYEFTEGDVITFSCPNAEHISVTSTMQDEEVIVEADGAECSWTATPMDEDMFTVTATLGETVKTFEFTLVVTAKPEEPAPIPSSNSTIFEQVTSTSQLVNGAKYVLINKPFVSGKASYGTYVMSTKASGKGLDVIKINPDATELDSKYDLSEISGYATITLVATETEGEWNLKVGEQYLDGSTVKTLKLGDEPKAVTITIDETATAKIKTGTDSNKDVTIQMFFQNSNNQPAGEVFNAYSSAQKPLVLYRQVVTPAHPSVKIDDEDVAGEEEIVVPLDGKAYVMVAFGHEDSANHTVYHKFEISNQTASTPAAQAEEAEDGFTPYSEAVKVSRAGTLRYYAKHNESGAQSPTRVITFTGVSTDIKELNAEGAATEYYDLSGRRIASPAKGIVIKKTGSKVSKEIF